MATLYVSLPPPPGGCTPPSLRSPVTATSAPHCRDCSASPAPSKQEPSLVIFLFPCGPHHPSWGMTPTLAGWPWGTKVTSSHRQPFMGRKTRNVPKANTSKPFLPPYPTPTPSDRWLHWLPGWSKSHCPAQSPYQLSSCLPKSWNSNPASGSLLNLSASISMPLL